jgi:hypothetical protein
MWAVKKGKATGKYIAVLNNTTRQNYFNQKALKNVFRFNLLYFWPAVFCSALFSVVQ